jgi:hypothetical protein
MAASAGSPVSSGAVDDVLRNLHVRGKYRDVTGSNIIRTFNDPFGDIAWEDDDRVRCSDAKPFTRIAIS